MAQFNLTLTIPDDVAAQEILDAFCAKYNYIGGGEGLTQRQFLKQEVREFVIGPWAKWRIDRAEQQARAAELTIINNVTVT